MLEVTLLSDGFSQDQAILAQDWLKLRVNPR